MQLKVNTDFSIETFWYLPKIEEKNGGEKAREGKNWFFLLAGSDVQANLTRGI